MNGRQCRGCGLGPRPLSLPHAWLGPRLPTTWGYRLLGRQGWFLSNSICRVWGELEQPHLHICRKGVPTRLQSSPQKAQKLGHAGASSNVTTAIESPTGRDLQGHLCVTVEFQRLTPGLGCISLSCFNLIRARHFLLVFLKAPTTSAVALMKVMFPKTAKH